MILQNIWRRVVGNIGINISPSNIFLAMLLRARFDQNCQAVLDAVSTYGLEASKPWQCVERRLVASPTRTVLTHWGSAMRSCGF